MTRVLVTGASGYIGRYLVKELLDKGDGVTVLLRRPAAQLPVLQDWLRGQGADISALQAWRAIWRGRRPGLTLTAGARWRR